MNKSRTQDVSLPPSPSVVEDSRGQLSITLNPTFKRHGGRKKVLLPDGSCWKPATDSDQPTPLQHALARGYRWLGLLESGQCRTITDIAKREKVDNSYVSRMLNLTLLAPDIVEGILDDSLPEAVILFALAVDPPRLWAEQRQHITSHHIGH